jgi:hypothetical protein
MFIPDETTQTGIGAYRPGFMPEQMSYTRQSAVPEISPELPMAPNTNAVSNTGIASLRPQSRSSLPQPNIAAVRANPAYLPGAAMVNPDPASRKINMEEFKTLNPVAKEAKLRRAGNTGQVISGFNSPMLTAINSMWGKGHLKGFDRAYASNPQAVQALINQFTPQYQELLSRNPKLSGAAGSPTRGLLKDLRSKFEAALAGIATPELDAHDAQIQADIAKYAKINPGRR